MSTTLNDREEIDATRSVIAVFCSCGDARRDNLQVGSIACGRASLKNCINALSVAIADEPSSANVFRYCCSKFNAVILSNVSVSAKYNTNKGTNNSDFSTTCTCV